MTEAVLRPAGHRKVICAHKRHRVTAEPNCGLGAAHRIWPHGSTLASFVFHTSQHSLLRQLSYFTRRLCPKADLASLLFSHRPELLLLLQHHLSPLLKMLSERSAGLASSFSYLNNYPPNSQQ